ncbi:MAG: hypothetical protein AAF628_30445 [Planctomycetota bacterium]
MSGKHPAGLVVHYVLLLPLAACGVFGLSQEDRQSLVRYQSNAQIYWEGGRLDQAMDQVRRGLELAPDDYKLRTIRAWCRLRQANEQPQLVDDVVAEFDALLDLRGDDEHGPQARLGYAKAHSLRGVRALQQARELEASLTERPTSDKQIQEATAQIGSWEEEAMADFDHSEQELTKLTERGESLLMAHYDLMTVKWWRGDYESAVIAGNAYLARVFELQDRVRRELERTLIVGYEEEERSRLQRLTDDELNVRAFIANMHYKRGHHDLVVDQLDAVLAKDPERHHQYYNRGRSFAALGRSGDARRDLERFLATTRLPRDSTQVRDALRQLRELP